MYHRPVSGTHLNRGHPFIFFELAFQNNVLIGQLTLDGNPDRLRHFQDQVWFGDRPSNYPCSGRRRRWAFGGTTGHPLLNCFDLLRCESGVVFEMAKPLVGKPWWHSFAFHRFQNRLRPWPRLLIVSERHRSNFAGTVAHHTALLQHRLHVNKSHDCRKQQHHLQGTRFIGNSSGSLLPSTRANRPFLPLA